MLIALLVSSVIGIPGAVEIGVALLTCNGLCLGGPIGRIIATMSYMVGALFLAT